MQPDEKVAELVRQTMHAFLQGNNHVATWMYCHQMQMVRDALGPDKGVSTVVRAANSTLVSQSADNGDPVLGPLKTLHIDMDGPTKEHVTVFYRLAYSRVVLGLLNGA